MKKLNIAIIGFGTVGGGLYSLLEKNAEVIAQRTGIDISVTAVCDVRSDHVKKTAPGARIVSDWKEIVKDKSVDIVAELIGGIEPAKSIIMEALKNGKGVVTANKKLLAEDGRDIFKQANAGAGRIGFEAAVGGGIPCILALRHGLVGNRMRSIMGILNGTTNFILTMMRENNMPFPEALRDAQEKGFAEADPTFDIEGYDAGHKIALLAMIAFNKNISYGDIRVEGISHISKADIAYARDMGYVIKLLGIAKEIDGNIDIRVHPTMIPEGHHLASVRYEYNSIMFDGDMTDPVILTGRGAGASPTASAVLSDIVQIAQQGPAYVSPLVTDGDARLIEPGKRMSRYYLRMQTDDRPGILSQIAGVFGRHGISIASVIQKELHAEHVPLIFMTHEAVEEGMMRALEEITKFNFTHGGVMLIRVEDSI
ncbi:MAG TPA: homoserine dehydrogenase [Spirochaetota bacterium]|nr:homoserine dehydrogenase [Spirochaetota bacterium]HPV39965.1 homoserine dehydrogenase [Spirochaetota bacterium]